MMKMVNMTGKYHITLGVVSNLLMQMMVFVVDKEFMILTGTM